MTTSLSLFADESRLSGPVECLGQTFQSDEARRQHYLAMRTGFKHASGNKDYATIIAIAQKVPEDALQEDEKLLMWYDQALTRMESGT